MKTENEKLLKLAQEIQPHFSSFYLAGGTAIMLRNQHRISFDLDFFSYQSFSFRRLTSKLGKLFPVENETQLEDNIDFIVRGIKVSFVYFPFRNVLPVEKFKGIKFASDYDLFLNKIYVAGRRIDPKDPFDAAFLYEKSQWDKDRIKVDFEKKFPHQSYEIYLGALLNFEDYPELEKHVMEVLLQLL